MVTVVDKPVVLAEHQVEALERVKLFIAENAMETLGYEELCRVGRINEDLLVRGFRQLFKTSPYQYQMEVKFTEVKRLLLETEDSIARISEWAGYSHVPSFMRAFRERFGCSPGKWRLSGEKAVKMAENTG